MAHQKFPILGPNYNPGNARWCVDHNRLECVKQRSRGQGTCHQAAVRGLDACKRHNGKKFEVALIEGESRITAWSAMGRPDGERIDAGLAVLGMLQQSWLRANLYGELLRKQVEKDGLENPDLEAGGLTDNSGLIGYRFGAAGKEGHIYATNEEVRALVALESAERDRAVKYAETAHKMGISDRLTSVAEKWGDLVVGRIMVLLSNLDLTPEQEARVPELIQAHLGSIDVTASA